MVAALRVALVAAGVAFALESLNETSSYFFAHAYTWECTFCTAFFAEASPAS